MFPALAVPVCYRTLSFNKDINSDTIWALHHNPNHTAHIQSKPRCFQT